jgi:Exonuclease VII small subunit
MSDRTINEMFENLDEVVQKLSSEENTLEESFALYQDGMQLLKACNDKIDVVEKKILVMDTDGEKHEF